MKLSFPGTSESSIGGNFILGNLSPLELSFPRTFAPRNFHSQKWN